MTGDETAKWEAGWRLARALCGRAGGRLRAEQAEDCGGFYRGVALRRVEDGKSLGFLNVAPDCLNGGSLHVFRRLDGAPPDQGQDRFELDWRGPRQGQPWPERTLAQAAGALGLTVGARTG